MSLKPEDHFWTSQASILFFQASLVANKRSIYMSQVAQAQMLENTSLIPILVWEVSPDRTDKHWA